MSVATAIDNAYGLVAEATAIGIFDGATGTPLGYRTMTDDEFDLIASIASEYCRNVRRRARSTQEDRDESLWADLVDGVTVTRFDEMLFPVGNRWVFVGQFRSSETAMICISTPQGIDAKDLLSRARRLLAEECVVDPATTA